jgi:hypothetical protein
MKPHLTPSYNIMESPTTGEPSPMPLAAPLPPNGKMHPILQECLAAGEAIGQYYRETPEGQALIAAARSRRSQAKKPQQD